MIKSTKSTKIAKKASELNDLEKFTAGPPSHRLDDKAAELEQEIQDIKRECKRIYFVLTFISTTFFLLFVSSAANTATTGIAIILCLIFLIGTATWLDFPWVMVNLQGWLDKLQSKPGRKEEVEPIPDESK